MSPSLDETRQASVDRSEIIEVLNRYARGIDARDSELLRSCFTERVDIQTSGTQMEQEPAHEWVALALRAVGVFESTQHTLRNHHVELQGKQATCTADLQADHRSPEGVVTVFGRYSTRLERLQQGWRIARLELTVTQTRSPTG